MEGVIILGLVIFVIYQLIFEFIRAGMKDIVCPNCYYVGKPAIVTKGNFLVEIALWLFFLVPGLIYSLWRSTSRYKAYPKCKTPNPVPIDTPRGQELLAQIESENL